jgi:SpoVK/Ycf46/Vps4 family AAA+-type ATPase
MLAVAERILVLLDEFDEMVRAREDATDVLSRFLTTAMLPKLNKINDNRRLAFIVATNHIEDFDVAIKRPGRFDILLQVMPPTADEKLRKWPQLEGLVATGMSIDDLKKKIEPLTYTETETLVRRLSAATTPHAKHEIIDAAHTKCTLLDPSNKEKWAEICEQQSALSRIS